MEIILKQDVHNLGYTNDILKVKNGYARNYLVPQGIAIVATESNRKILAENLKQKAFKDDKIRKEAQSLAQRLENITVKIGAKAAATGKIFGSVNTIQIAEAIKEQHNIEVDRKKITIMGDHIKELGEYKAMINLHKESKVEISLEVFGE
ncbi:MAG: 50S ribosomal protein L9 [Bacteroidota bacterium]